MVKTIQGRYCHSKKLLDNVGLIFQTHFHNNNLPNTQCLISRHHSTLMLILKIKKQVFMHNTTGFFCRQSLVKTSLEVQSFVQYYITCIEDEVERRSQVLKVIGES